MTVTIDRAEASDANSVSNPRILTLAILSDLHAYDPRLDPNYHGHLQVTAAQSDPFRQPFAGLYRLIDRYELTADVVLCAGDMTNQANPVATAFAWSEIHRTAKKLEANLVLGAVGNHDWDSRFRHDRDPKAAVKSLDPPFPTPDISANTKFWADSWCIIEHEAVRYLIVNSCQYHGYEEEYKHGRVEKRTVDEMRRHFESIVDKKLNVLLTHHHPHRIGAIDLEDYSEMICGHLLLDAISQCDIGPWLVVHGHKHMPNLAYASGGATSPLVFSAGSFSAELYSELATIARNQFYLVDVYLDAPQEMDLHMAGTFRAYDWHTATGWKDAAPGQHLPPEGGFGCRTDPNRLAKLIVDEFDSTGSPYLERRELEALVPELQFLLPVDEAVVFQRVIDYGTNVTTGSDGRIGVVTLSREKITERLSNQRAELVATGTTNSPTDPATPASRPQDSPGHAT